MELEDIILTIDTREQNQLRIKSVEEWFTEHNAVVEHSVLKHCDYRLIGEFRGISVNLGVEAKGWDNFLSDSIDEMEEKLLLATAEYDHVGFFVETQNYTFTPDENNSHGKLNYSIPKLNKSLPTKTLASMEGMFDTIGKHPQIHVRQLRGEAQFPYSLYDLLVYLQKSHKIKLSDTEWMQREVNRRMEFIGFGVKKAAESIKYHPNLFWLCSSSEESLKQIYGAIIGQTLYDEIHNHEYETDEWRNGYHKDGTFKPMSAKDNHPDGEVCPVAVPKRCGEVNAYKCIGNTCVYHPSHVPESIPSGPSGGSGTDTLQSLSNSRAVCGPSREGGTKPKRPDECNSTVTQDAIGGQSVKSRKQHVPADSSHPEAASFEHPTHESASGDNILGVPPIVSTNDGSGDTSYLYEKTKCVVKCRACHQVIIPENDDDTGFCHNSECIEERAKPKQKMNLKETIKDFMADGKPHLLQDIVNRCEGWTPKYIFDHVMGAVKSGYFKKITEQDGRVITFQKV